MTAMWQRSSLNKLDPMAFDVLIGPVCEKRQWTLVFAELLITGGKLDFHTDEAAIIQLRREIAYSLVTDSGRVTGKYRESMSEDENPVCVLKTENAVAAVNRK
ncbi:hypothetical protein F2P81_025604 [Scophthalmus maximus]|uniref:Uncharacterized protein n=1 Tax=Scophthalmus maximus TaxID=52904 RepID=A0A6A4RJT5_SCOMX|nr:hypothetical protein F2P81_025604 [Scophthalmus maximus]